jgi:hypothetical protein
MAVEGRLATGNRASPLQGVKAPNQPSYGFGGHQLKLIGGTRDRHG